MKVLVADDDLVSRTVLEKVVRRLGYDPILTVDGREALTRIQLEEIPLLITDWQMPDIDGLELCRRLRAPGRKVYTYAILLTARSGKANYLAALEAGADDFLTKPVDGDELAARLRVGERIVGLQKEMRQMEGLLSICGRCKKIREDGTWVPVDEYVAGKTATSFSHALCPECLAKQLAE
jgi:DNA-binding response OmpR family regulator